MLSDSRFATAEARLENREELDALVRQVMLTHPTSYWEKLLTAFDVPHGPVLGVFDALTSEYASFSDALVAMMHPTAGSVDIVASPIRVDGEHATGGSSDVLPPPLLGQDTLSILLDVGATEDEIAEMLNSGLITQSETTATK